MIIRKKFNVESAHIVRNCTSERCSHSIHGHSAVIEVFLECHSLDNAQMVYDFGLMKDTIKSFIDSMDHCYLLCKYDKPEFKDFIKSNCERWIELPCNPSAEMLSVYIFHGVHDILEHTVMNNGEGEVRVKAVRYHETATGYAETDWNDMIDLWKDDDVKYSLKVEEDWSENLKLIMQGEYVSNYVVEQQIEIK